jgi:hypothetical protein
MYLFNISPKMLFGFSILPVPWHCEIIHQCDEKLPRIHSISTFFCLLSPFTFFKLLFSTVVSSSYLFQAKKTNWNCTTMCRTTISVICLAMAGLSFAQTSTRRELFTTVTLYVPGADVQPLVASIVGSVGRTTKYPRFLLTSPGCNSYDLCDAMR